MDFCYSSSNQNCSNKNFYDKIAASNLLKFCCKMQKELLPNLFNGIFGISNFF
jgi:hypothetical protein